MSYQVLARKWRPRNFQEMVGQEHVVRMLSNALRQNRLHHAYLFTGTRGVGKTTLARILAKCLNCETGMTPTPCEQCKICESINTGKFLDLIEIDAASRTKVEDTREILDNVQYAPSQGRFKIYLIDEVHMLSGHSFNALLKTLEEPPTHVKFLLATTDPKRLPITILSRCLQFNLKRVPLEQIEAHLCSICDKEQIQYESQALQLVAKAADGSLRDALSLLDQTIAYCQNNLSLKETSDMLGTLSQESIYRLLEALAANDGPKLLFELKELTQYAPDCESILEELLNVLHQISLAQVISADSFEQPIKQLATLLSREEVQLYYQIALTGQKDLPLAPTPNQGLEMVFLRLLAFRPYRDTESLSKTQLNKTASEKKEKKALETVTTTTESFLPTTNQDFQTQTEVEKPLELSHVKNWADLLPNLKLTGLTQTLAANCSLHSIKDSQLILALAKKHEPMLNKKLQERIEQNLSSYFKKPIKLEFKITTDDIETPAKIEKIHQENRQLNATDAIKNDTGVQKIVDLFGGTLDVTSIKPIG